jgi:hypothetical protein
MKQKAVFTLVAAAVITVITGCATTSGPAVQAPAESAAPLANDYPTRDRVEYVFNCVAQHGGLTYITQYACGCKIDKIAEKMSFNDYDAAKTFGYLGKGQTGDAGSVFRDPKQAKDLKKQLKEAEEFAEKSCFVK